MSAWRLTRHRKVAEAPPRADPELAAELARQIDASARRRLGRGLALLHVPGGDCGGCALELSMLDSAVYGLERLGMRFVTTPLHADVLLCTGPLTRNLREAVERCWSATPDPKWVVAVGDCAVDGGVFRSAYAVEGGAGAAVPVDLLVRGCPPRPAEILAGLAALLAANG